MTNYANIRYQPAAASTTTVADIAALIALTGMSNGDQALVQATNKLYMYSGTGWYLIATIQNDAPSAITGVNGTYELAIDGTATTITAASTDPEGFPLTWSYSTSGLGSIATVSNTDNVFTITPSTTEADAGTFTLTINATDGVNGAVSKSTSLTLNFIVIVTNSKYTTLLATAVDTSDNNNITDASSNSHSITVNGEAHAGTFSPYRSGGYSWDFDGSTSNDSSTSRITATPSSTLSLGTGDYTVEMWVKSRSSTSIQSNGNYRLFEVANSSGGERIAIRDNGYGDSRFSVMENGSQLYRTSSGTNPYTGEWEWIQIIRDNGATKAYVNGSERGSASSTTDISGINKIYIGSAGSSGIGYGFNGNIRDFRISNIARSTTVPTEPLESDSNTLILACNKGYLIDQGPNSIPLALSSSSNKSDPAASATSPYDYNEYSAADNGGSMNFDGTGDYLTIPDHSSLNFGSNDWTIECWVYPRTNVGDCGIWHQSASGTDWYSIYLDGAFNLKFVFYNASNGVEWAGTAASNTAPQNTWTHVALVRQFGTGVYLYANGKLVASDTLDASVTMLDKTYNHVIGYERFVGSGTYFDGLISDFKMDIGTAHYTGEFTPPTAPLSSTAADLHIKGTDASIIDKSQGTNLKLIGNTTGSTTQVKFAGSKSMYFDGSDDHIEGPTVSDLNIGTGDFTIECWIYETTTNTNKGIWDGRLDGTSTDGFTFTRIGVDTFRVWSGGALITTGSFTIQNTWNHCALVRNSGTLTIYINGTSSGTPVSNSTNFSNSGTLIIGAGRHSTGSNPTAFITGYIQDLRVNNYARYTTNFTPPTASLEG